MGTHPIFESDFDCLTDIMVSEEQLKAEEEQLLNEDLTPAEAEAEASVAAEVTPAPAPAAAATPAANNNGKKAENVEETHVTTFDVTEHGAQFHREIVNLRDEKKMNDGHLVFASNGERKRVSVLMSAISSGSVKLMNAFYHAKRTMMEHGFFHTSIDLKLPPFARAGTSSPESAVRAVISYIYTGQLNVSSMNIKNIAVLAAYLEIEPIMDLLPGLAAQLNVDDFDMTVLKSAGEALPEMTVDGLKKFVEAGFGTTTKMRTGDKRKNQAAKKQQPPKKPKVEEKPADAASTTPTAATPATATPAAAATTTPAATPAQAIVRT